MFRLQFEALESRENPSGPGLLDPTAPLSPPTSTDPVATQPPAPTTPPADPSNVPPAPPVGPTNP